VAKWEKTEWSKKKKNLRRKGNGEMKGDIFGRMRGGKTGGKKRTLGGKKKAWRGGKIRGLMVGTWEMSGKKRNQDAKKKGLGKSSQEGGRGAYQEGGRSGQKYRKSKK